MEKRLRSPILVGLGHVDHGKTTLVDKVRGTAVAATEPGLITQYISASYIPSSVISRVCGPQLSGMGIALEIPGLLWVDSPGHEAFTTLRKRGGAIADLAVLVIDVNEGFRPQTDESLNFLKQFRTPFVVAATKIDRMLGWQASPGSCFLPSFEEQPDSAQSELETKVYGLVGQLAERGFSAERFDRVTDFTKQACIVPVSGVTGEGIPDLLMVIAGMAQRYLKGRLRVTPGEGKGTVLEVREYRGLGTTIDVILYDGEMRRGDYLVIGGEDTVTTRVKALLEPGPLREMRMEKSFRPVDSVTAAAGVKVASPGLEGVIAGSPVRSVGSESLVGKARLEVRREIEEVRIETDSDGIILRADTLGSLEALIKTLKGESVRIRKAAVGDVSKADVLEAMSMKDPIIMAFGGRLSPDTEKLAKDNKVPLFHSGVIYSLVDSYRQWVSDERKRAEERLAEATTMPGRIRALPGYVFRQSRPAVFGVEVLAGRIRPGCKLTAKGRVAGEVREIQLRGDNVREAAKGEKVAISMDGVTIGKDLSEGDVLDVFLSRADLANLEKLGKRLTDDERELLQEYGKD
jgi:translation initiation factor 5B